MPHEVYHQRNAGEDNVTHVSEKRLPPVVQPRSEKYTGGSSINATDTRQQSEEEESFADIAVLHPERVQQYDAEGCCQDNDVRR